MEMSSSDNKKPFPCTGKTPASAIDDIKYGFYLSLLKKLKDCTVVKGQKREDIYISQHKCDKSGKKILGSCQKCRLKRGTACPNSLHKNLLL